MRGSGRQDIDKAEWLDPSWISWEERPGISQNFLDRDAALRAYKIYEHAYARLSGQATDLDRVDAVTAMRRAIDQRARLLNEIYGLRAIPLRNKPKATLEILAYFGVVRPLMLRRLIDVRNLVEHQHSDPPELEECLILADFVWYFLRSTDSLARMKIVTITYQPSNEQVSEEVTRSVAENTDELIERLDAKGEPYILIGEPTVRPFVDVTYGDPRHTLPSIRASVPSTYFSDEPRSNWIELRVSKRTDHAAGSWATVTGEFRGPEEQMHLVWTRYFSEPI